MNGSLEPGALLSLNEIPAHSKDNDGQFGSFISERELVKISMIVTLCPKQNLTVSAF